MALKDDLHALWHRRQFYRQPRPPAPNDWIKDLQAHNLSHRTIADGIDEEFREAAPFLMACLAEIERDSATDGAPLPTDGSDHVA